MYFSAVKYVSACIYCNRIDYWCCYLRCVKRPFKSYFSLTKIERQHILMQTCRTLSPSPTPLLPVSLYYFCLANKYFKIHSNRNDLLTLSLNYFCPAPGMNRPARVAPVGEAFRFVKQNFGERGRNFTQYMRWSRWKTFKWGKLIIITQYKGFPHGTTR